MLKKDLIHHGLYIGQVQTDNTHYTMDDNWASMALGSTKYIRWDAEMNLFDVYDDAACTQFVTHTFYERFTNITPFSYYMCQRCGRLLKANQSVIRGYGASCYKKFLYEEWERNQMTIFDFIEEPSMEKIL